MQHFQTLGRADYRRKDFNGALKNFNRALDKGQSVQLLDNRAACHEKLGNLQAALQDAKSTIRLSKADATGYLRASRVLIRMEKKAVAAEICSHGLRSIRHVGQGYELLHQSLTALQDELSLSRKIDPLDILPRELAEDVFSYLSFKQRVVASSTSRSWRQFLCTSPRLWQHVDTSAARRFVKAAFFSRAINVARSQITEVSLNASCDMDMSLKALIRHCPLQRLTLSHCGASSHGLVNILRDAKKLRALRIGNGSEVRKHTLQALWHTIIDRLEVFECESLSSPDGMLEFRELNSDCTNLKALRLITAPGTSLANDLDHLFRSAPNLESLCLKTSGSALSLAGRGHNIECENLANLRQLDLAMYVTATTLTLPPALEVLRLSVPPGASLNSFFSAQEPIQTQYNLPALRELSLDIPGLNWNAIGNFILHVSYDNNDAAELLASKLSSLSITLHTLPTISELTAMASHSRLQMLEHFGLRTLVNQNVRMDELVAPIMASFILLKSLDLSESDVTGIGVKDAVKHGTLDRLALHDCYAVGKDAIEWAKAQRVRVEHRMANAEAGGRKVRY